MNQATAEQLMQYELIGKGTIFQRPPLDEELKLKGFIKDELHQAVNSKKNIITAWWF